MNRREKIEIIRIKNPNALFGFKKKIDLVFENLEDYNVTKKTKVLYS